MKDLFDLKFIGKVAIATIVIFGVASFFGLTGYVTDLPGALGFKKKSNATA